MGDGEPSDSGWELVSACGSVAVSGVLVVTDVGETALSAPWSAQDRTAVARMEQYVNNSECIKLEIAEVEDYHCCENNYRFDALQTNCFGINIKL